MKIADLAKTIDTELTDLVYALGGLMLTQALLEKRATYSDKAMEDLEKANTDIALLHRRINSLEAVWGNYQWSRAYIVPGGHVHKDYHCHTLFVDTQRYIAPAVSGLTEDEIVAQAGERACTVCYPSAPSDYLTRKSTLFTPDEVEKALKKAEMDAKRIAAEDAKFEAVVEGRKRTFKTVRAATNEALSQYGWHLYNTEYSSNNHPEYLRDFNSIVEAIAAKTGTDAETLRNELIAKADKKFQAEKRKASR